MHSVVYGRWYTITGTGQDFTANTCSSATNYDSMISVFEGTCSSLQCVISNDDSCGLQSSVTWSSESGKEYTILVHGYSFLKGDFLLDVSASGPVASPSPSSSQPTMNPVPPPSPSPSSSQPTTNPVPPPSPFPTPQASSITCPHDDTCNALDVAVDSGTPSTVVTIGCTHDLFSNVPRPFEVEIGSWVRFVAPASGCIDIDFRFVSGIDQFDTDAALGLYGSDGGGSACDAFPFEQLNLSGTANDGVDPRIVIDETNGSMKLNGGRTYYVLIGGIHSDEFMGTLEITDPCKPQPTPAPSTHHPTTVCPHDDKCNARDIVVGSNDDDNIISIIGCTFEMDIPTSGNIELSAWVTFVAPPSGCIKISFEYLHGVSQFDTDAALVLYEPSGNSCDSLPFQELAFNDNYDGEEDPLIVVMDSGELLTPGTRYYVLIGGIFGDELVGRIEINDPCE